MMSVVSTQSAEHYVWGGDCVGWRLLKSPGLSVIQERVPSGRDEMRHFHRHAHQFFFVISGRATREVDGHTVVLAGPSCSSVAAKVSHRLGNEESEGVVFVLVSTPPNHGDRVVVEEAP